MHMCVVCTQYVTMCNINIDLFLKKMLDIEGIFWLLLFLVSPVLVVFCLLHAGNVLIDTQLKKSLFYYFYCHLGFFLFFCDGCFGGWCLIVSFVGFALFFFLFF